MRDNNYKPWYNTILEMLDSEDYEWAEETLEGIGENIESNGGITDKQKEAIQNIQKSVR